MKYTEGFAVPLQWRNNDRNGAQITGVTIVYFTVCSKLRVTGLLRGELTGDLGIHPPPLPYQSVYRTHVRKHPLSRILNEKNTPFSTEIPNFEAQQNTHFF